MQTIKLEYDIFTEELYRLVESTVLGKHQFNDEQKKFIHFFETAIIEAGPGSGKTTSLAAKIALLFKKVEEEENNEGICVITHTNAAVNEIRKVLKNIGFSDVPHPHFIGTIHEFFNRFGMYPQISQKKSITDIQFNEQPFLERYFKGKLSIQHSWMNSNKDSYKKNTSRLIKRLLRSHIYLDNNNELDACTVESGAFEKYKYDYLKSKQEAWLENIYHVNDTFYFSQIYFSNDNNKQRIRNRFKFIFMDEYQDVAPLALDLLKDLFSTEFNIFQMIGDSNQHISYTNPPINNGGLEIYYLNETNRFGEKISQPLNRMFQGRLNSRNPEKSIKPLLYLYSSAPIIKEDFISLMSKSKVNAERNSKAILLAAHSHATEIEQAAEKTMNVKQKSVLQQSKNEINRLIASKMKCSIPALNYSLKRNFINEELEVNRNLLEYLRDSTKDTNGIKESINYLLESNNQGTKINSSNSLFDKLSKIRDEVQENQSTMEPIPVKTIHEIKGQTLIANMVYLQKSSKEEYGFLSSYQANVEMPRSYSEIDKRVVYVAMSRASTLLVVALHIDSYNSLSDTTKKLLEADFEIVNSDFDEKPVSLCETVPI